jgi:toxin CptA
MMTALQFASLAFALAAVCAAIMGYAIQRGATCMVAAVDEIVTQRRATRVVALGEAAVWVTGGVLVWRMLGGHVALPIGYPATLQVVAGGLVLGLGALIARACVFGAVARFGSGEWAYVLTPLGYYLGCVSLWPLIGRFPAMHVASPLLGATWLVAPFALFVLWRGWAALQAGRAGMFAAHVWQPHEATSVIGIVFALSLIAIGPWAYTSALLALAQGKSSGMVFKLVLFVMLFAGALAGGWTAGRLHLRMPTFVTALRCLIGGVLMGWGSLLIPGGNDDLILIGVPLLQPYAALAVGSMALAIGLGQIAERRMFAR